MKKLCFLIVLITSLYNVQGINNDTYDPEPVISHVYWITIHAREAEIYDSLYQLFVVDLQIPQFFDTETHGTRRYFTILIGNVILEPCGPFEFHPSFRQDVMTRYNTLAFRPYESAAASAARLKNLEFDITVKDQDELLNLTVDELSGDFLPVNVSKSAYVNGKDEIIFDSLENDLISRGGGPLGLEYIEEIHIGYRTDEYLDKWKEFLYPMEHKENLWSLPHKPNIRFFKSEREEIIALVLNVKSLALAAQYLKSKNLLGPQIGDRIEMDISWAHGIRIILTE